MERELENTGDPFFPGIRSDGTLFQISAPQGGGYGARSTGGGYGARSTGGGRERAPQGVLNALHMGGGYGLLDLPFLCDLFHYSIGFEPVGSVHFRAPAWPWRAGAIERGAARAADAKIALKHIIFCVFSWRKFLGDLG